MKSQLRLPFYKNMEFEFIEVNLNGRSQILNHLTSFRILRREKVQEDGDVLKKVHGSNGDIYIKTTIIYKNLFTSSCHGAPDARRYSLRRIR